MSASALSQTASTTEQQGDDVLAQVRQALIELRYGNVLLTVHDGALVQVDITEKRRFSIR